MSERAVLVLRMRTATSVAAEQTVLSLADVCRTAVRNPVGNVKADSQKIIGGWEEAAHFSNCSTRSTRSRVHDASGFIDGYACTHARIEG